jgi:hypothetical protein
MFVLLALLVPFSLPSHYLPPNTTYLLHFFSRISPRPLTTLFVSAVDLYDISILSNRSSYFLGEDRFSMVGYRVIMISD